MNNSGIKSIWKSFSANAKTNIFIVTILLIIILFILPLELPYSFSTQGKVLPLEDWIIVKGRNGELITLLKDNSTGISKSYTVNEFERGDNSRFSFNEKLRPGIMINKSDTIGSIFSNELTWRITSLKGQLEVTNALLNASITGEKVSLVKEANNNLDYSVTQREKDEKIFERQKELFSKGLISEQEFDSSKYLLELDEIAIKIAEAQLQTVQTGMKKEQLDWVRAQIRAYNDEIDVLEKRSAHFNLLSPVKGYIRTLTVGDTLLIVSDTAKYVILIPIPLEKRNYISDTTRITFIHPQNSESVAGELQSLGESIEYISSKPFVFATVVTDNQYGRILPGMFVECKLSCGRVSLTEYIKRAINSRLF